MSAVRARILVVDDNEMNRELIVARVEELGHDVRQARDGVEALDVLEQEEPDLILLDIDMPRLDGVTLCRQLKQDPRRRLIPVVLITALADRSTRLAGLTAGADDFLTKPVDGQELLVRTRVLLRDRELNKHLDGAEQVIFSLARAVEARDLYTVHHAERVGTIARELARALGLDADQQQLFYEGGVLHDLGKIGIPDAVLLKAGPLDEREQEIMRSHPVAGARIALPLRSISAAVPVIRHHHEHVDGTGYPDRLVGDAIPLAARVAAVADGWDAMTSDRAYRARLSDDQALGLLRAGAGSHWDAAVVDAFLHRFETGELAAALAHTTLEDR